MASKKNGTTKQPQGAKRTDPRRGSATLPSADAPMLPGVELGALAMRMAARADRLDGARAARLRTAAGVIWAVAYAIDAEADESLATIASAAGDLLRRARTRGEPIARVTNLDADRDTELTSMVAQHLAWLRDGALDQVRFLEGLSLWLRARGYADPTSAEDTLSRLRAAFPHGIDDEKTPSAIARAALRALGATAAELKNFGAGAKQRAIRKSPNRSRKR